MTIPHAWADEVLLQEDFKKLYSDWWINDVFAFELETGSFSSGQVADPFEKDSKTNSWLREKEAGGLSWITWDDPLSNKFNWCLFSILLDFKPCQGTATDAFEQNRSQDVIFLAFTGLDDSSSLTFHRYTLESSHADRICFPSEVNDAHIGLPVLRPGTKIQKES